MTKEKIRTIILVTLVVVLILIPALAFSTSVTPKKQTCLLTDEWDASFNDKLYTNINFKDLSTIDYGTFRKGDLVTISTMLPKLNVDFPSLFFKSDYCAFTIELLDLNTGIKKQIYTYQMDRYNQRKFVGCDYHIINLPDNYYQYELIINCYINTTTKEFPLTTPTAGDTIDNTYMFISNYNLALSVSIFFLIFGISFLFISVMFAKESPTAKVQILNGILCIDIGIWLMTYYNLYNIFFESDNMTLISYIALILIMPISYTIINEIHPSKNKTIFTIISFINVFVPIELLVLHMSDTVYLNETRTVYFVTVVITFICFFSYFIRDLINMNHDRRISSSSNRLQLYGIIIFGACGTLEFVVEYILKAPLPIRNIGKDLLIPLGTLVYLISVIFNYIIYSTEGLARNQQYKKLSELAYADSLTKLPNRAASDSIMKKLANSNKNYCIVSIDINNLKEVNDTYGHAQGDVLISDFSTCLVSFFDDIGVSARVGGDEFIIFIESIKQEDLEKRLQLLKISFKSLTKPGQNYEHSFAYGYAFKNNLENPSPHSVYMTADQLMYNMKRQQHMNQK
ncbi:GGDEF domain-containing protein [Lachnospira multipara]|uniref:GGDEF domain-containing protein n=1 Tax=Lachnospira multipara TaxID=28051 RepID=UPI0004E1BE2E|nr:GGDEF domain-containing protein [Lachnospira multipara]